MSFGPASSWRSVGMSLLLLAFCLGSAAPSRAGPDPALAPVSACIDQIHNGGYETGNFMYWTTGGSPSVLASGGHTGSHSALLGGTNQDYDEISQELPCPYYGAKVVVHAYVYMSTQDWQEWADWLRLSAYDTRGAGGDSYYYNNNTPGEWWPWTFSSTGAGACEPGVAWTVRFRAETDAGLPTSFLIDDVSLEVCCPDDATEPNDSFGAARTVSPGIHDAWLCPNGDEDWYQFSAATGQTLVADLTNAGTLQGDLCLYRPDGSQAACSANPGATAPEHVEWVADQSGSWRARVYDPAGGTSTAASQLRIQVRDQPTPTTTATATSQASSTPTATGQAQATATPTRTPTRTATPPGWSGQRLFLPMMLKSFWQPRPEDCTELLLNGDLETGALSPWGHIGDAGLGVGRNSAYAGQLGGRDNASGELWQWVTIPADADAAPWDFWWKAECASAQPDDYLNVRLEADGEEPTLLTLRAEAPLNVWQKATVDLGAWAGRTVLAGYLVRTDGSVPTTFRVDDISLRACRQP
jgi:hypothetical protein